MQFVLNDTWITETNLPADLTLLRYLRENQHLPGTKEGCASGDCGACTVLIGTLRKQKDKEIVDYLSVNACIAPVAMVQGNHVVTVEHLADNSHNSKASSEPVVMHPSQAAMVKYHGSQCGFCTPGFVMSLTGLYESKSNAEQRSATRDEVCEAISGNLCRCTGYRPIVDAGCNMFNDSAFHTGEHSSLFNDDTVKQLHSINAPSKNHQYIRPDSIDALNHALTNFPNAKIIAGGTDLMLEVTQHFKHLPELIDLTQIPQMMRCGIFNEKDSDDNNVQETGTLVIGAAVTYSQIEKQLATIFPELCKLLTRLGSRQIRNRGTFGGNIGNASPIADIPPILLSMDAKVEIGAADGTTRFVSLENFYLGYKKTVLNPNEYIISLQLPSENLQHFHRFYKVSKRIEDDISSVMVAIRLNIENATITTARIAYGGMAATPVRMQDAEKCLQGADIQSDKALDNAIASLKKHLHPLSDVRASSQYRLNIAINLLHKAWLEANGESMPDLGHNYFEANTSGGVSHA